MLAVTSSPSSGPSLARAGIDVGRLAFVPVGCGLLVASVVRATHTDAASLRTTTGLLQFVAQVLIIAFYVLMIVLFMTRHRATATTKSRLVRTAAVAATWLPLSIPLLGARSSHVPMLVVADGLIVVGLTWSVWSLRTLGRSFSIVPQARQIVTAGPYRLVRHPLYIGELAIVLGVAMGSPSVWTACAWVALVLLQGFRALHEERVLVAMLDEYPAYQAKTARLLPGFF